MRTINSIFKSFVLGLLLFTQVHFAYAQTAALLPVAPQQFLDKNGNPVSSGSVGYYIPGTSTFKSVWQDDAQTVLWSNPITLNAGGWPPNNKGIYGNGVYRQIIKDKFNNVISDQPTAAVGAGGGSGTSVGDGNSVGTILTWSGMIAPNQYQFAYGQALARTSFPELLQAVTQKFSANCVGGNTTISGIADTSNIPVGAAVEASCIVGASTVVSKTISSITLTLAPNVTTVTNVTVFPYGNGDGSTTYNVPDLRGKVVPGRSNMGGVTASNLTSTYYGSSPNAVGANGGTESKLVAQVNLPAIKPPITITDPGHSHNYNNANVAQTTAGNAGLINIFGSPAVTSIATSTSMTFITAAFTNNLGSATPLSVVQPSITMNYVIKVTPDTSVSGLFGVASIGGMQGIIACGLGLTCAGNTITALAGVAAGSNTQVQFNNSGAFAGDPCFVYASQILILGRTGCGGQLAIGGGTSGFLTQAVNPVAGTPIVTWGNSTGTPAVTASAPLSINSTTGNITTTTGNLTKTDDTNVTLTLGGTPTASLLNAVSLTMGWNGTLSVPRGGTGANSFTSGAPLVGNGTSTLTAGTKSGNTTQFVTTTGAQTAGNCVQIDVNGNHIDAGAACGTGGGGGGNTYDTVAALIAATVVGTVNSVTTLGYYARGDGGGTTYVRVASAPSKPCAQTSNAGASFWDLSNRQTVNVKWCGAKGDNTTDDGVAIANSLLALGGTSHGGGTVYFPSGNYLTSTTAINIQNTTAGVNVGGIAFVGDGSSNGAEPFAPTSQIIYTSAGSGNLVALNGVEAIRFDHLGLRYNNAGYTGNLIELTSSLSPPSNVVTAFVTFNDFFIGGSSTSVSGAASLVNARRTLKTYFKHGWMANANTGIVGAVTLAQDFNNVLVVDDVWFNGRFASAPIVAGGQQWAFNNCIFEPPTAVAGQARGIVTTAAGIYGMQITNSNFADASQNSSSWIDLLNNFGYGVGTYQGISISGSLFQTNGASIVMGSGVTGIEFTGNQFYMTGAAASLPAITGGNAAKNVMVNPGNYVTSLGGAGVGTVIDNQTNNYTLLPNKKMIAWGTASGITTSYSAVSYGVTFGAAPLVVGTSANGAAVVNIGTAGTTSVQMAINSGTLPVNWTAIGAAP